MDPPAEHPAVDRVVGEVGNDVCHALDAAVRVFHDAPHDFGVVSRSTLMLENHEDAVSGAVWSLEVARRPEEVESGVRIVRWRLEIGTGLPNAVPNTPGVVSGGNPGVRRHLDPLTIDVQPSRAPSDLVIAHELGTNAVAGAGVAPMLELGCEVPSNSQSNAIG